MSDDALEAGFAATPQFTTDFCEACLSFHDEDFACPEYLATQEGPDVFKIGRNGALCTYGAR